MNNYWLSIIIPLYNAEETIEETLNSIVAQNDNDIEVVICNDHSTDNSLEICHTFDEKLHIIYCETEPRAMHCPGNTRHDAFPYATGKWVTFIDNDDKFVENAFAKVKEQATSEPTEDRPHTMITTQYQITYNGEPSTIIYNQYSEDFSCLHGKFFNKDFLQNANLELPLNINMYEDVYFNQLVRAYMIVHNLDFYYIPETTYLWNVHGSSLSHKFDSKGIDHSEYYLPEYHICSIYPYLEMYAKYPNNKEAVIQKINILLIYIYFIVQMIAMQNEPTLLKMSKLRMQETLQAINRIMGVKIDTFIKDANESIPMYNSLRQSAIDHLTYGFVEQQTFAQFLTECWEM